ncbi:hypothetical protein ABEB36_005244 [Hypothenemus hampei]
MLDLKNRFKTDPIFSVPDFPEYVVSKSTILMTDLLTWPHGKLRAQKPYRYQDIDPLGAEHFTTVQFLGPVSMTNFKMHPSWEEANVVVRIWSSFIDYNKWNHVKWHLVYEASHSKDFSENYKECSKIVNMLRIEFNKNFPKYIMVARGMFYHVLTEGVFTQFPLFYPLSNKVWHNGVQELTNNIVIRDRESGAEWNGRNVTENLPPEIMYNIFDCLDLVSLSRCAQVNKRWNLISQDLRFYRDVDLKIYWNKINENSLKILKEKLRNVRKLDMTWFDAFQLDANKFHNSIMSILERAQNTLTHLCLNDTCWLTEPILEQIFECLNLEELRFRNKDFRHINDWYPISCNKMTKLKTLDITLCVIRKTQLIGILQLIPNLEHLIMDSCKHLGDPEPIISTVIKYNSKLKTWSSAGTFNNRDSSEIFKKFGKLVHLEYLNLTFCEPQSHRINCLESIAMNCKNLKR